jgi:hypothetical protein
MKPAESVTVKCVVVVSVGKTAVRLGSSILDSNLSTLAFKSAMVWELPMAQIKVKAIDLMSILPPDLQYTKSGEFRDLPPNTGSPYRQ